jgi:hypothetical protein
MNPSAVEAQLHHFDLGDPVNMHQAADSAHGHGQNITLKRTHHASTEVSMLFCFLKLSEKNQT